MESSRGEAFVGAGAPIVVAFDMDAAPLEEAVAGVSAEGSRAVFADVGESTREFFKAGSAILFTGTLAVLSVGSLSKVEVSFPEALVVSGVVPSSESNWDDDWKLLFDEDSNNSCPFETLDSALTCSLAFACASVNPILSLPKELPSLSLTSLGWDTVVA